MNILRRASLAHLLTGIAVTVIIGVSLTALALALGTGPVPPAKPLAQAVHDALAGNRPTGFSANIELTDHLLDGAQLATGDGQGPGGGGGGGGGGGLTSSPLVNGASGRLWVSSDGRFRIELQAEQGDTQIVGDSTSVRLYDASSNTLYVYRTGGHTGTGDGGGGASAQQAPPSVAQIEESIAHLDRHTTVSGAQPTDVGGRPAYTVRISPRETGSLLAGVELSFDADNGTPLRAAVYSTQSSTPVLELAASSVSYGPVDPSVFSLTPPSNAKVEEVTLPSSKHDGNKRHAGTADRRPGAADRAHVHVHGHGPAAIAVIEARSKGSAADLPAGLPHVKLGSTSAAELQTELGTLLSFERSGVRYFVLGAVAPAAVEALARGL